MIKVEVAYATEEKQLIVEVDVEEGTTLRQAAIRSGIDHEFDDLDLNEAPMGIFGRKVAKPDQEEVKEGDRVEIYRPLKIDPKQARLNRAAKAKADKGSE
ncbi:RnfH family protein [Reinekea blandensis]|nr:RnfH family protein [Reinekea blandensis]